MSFVSFVASIIAYVKCSYFMCTLFTQFHQHKLLHRIDRQPGNFGHIEIQCQWICALLSFYPALVHWWANIEIVSFRNQTNCNDHNLVTVNNLKPYVCKRKQQTSQIGVQLMLKYLVNLNIWYLHRCEQRNNNANIMFIQCECFLLNRFFFHFLCIEIVATKRNGHEVMSWLLSMIRSCSVRWMVLCWLCAEYWKWSEMVWQCASILCVQLAGLCMRRCP